MLSILEWVIICHWILMVQHRTLSLNETVCMFMLGDGWVWEPVYVSQ